MKILLIGLGKMGHYILDVLVKIERVTDVFVCDSHFDRSFVKDGINYLQSIDEIEVSSFDCIFIATPATTHYNIITDLIEHGAKKIYVEKPAVVTEEEYYGLKDICNEAMIVTGYILRQVPFLNKVKSYMAFLKDEGFCFKKCDVKYQKYLPTGIEERTWTDLGVFDEMVHILDLLFNYFEIRKGDIISLDKSFVNDKIRKDRIIEANIFYKVLWEGKNAEINLFLSFLKRDKLREFSLLFENEYGERRTIIMSFDNADEYDRVSFIASGEVIYEDCSLSLNKLSHQMEEVLHYFDTGDLLDLCPIDDTKILIDLMNQLTV